MQPVKQPGMRLFPCEPPPVCFRCGIVMQSRYRYGGRVHYRCPRPGCGKNQIINQTYAVVDMKTGEIIEFAPGRYYKRP